MLRTKEISQIGFLRTNKIGQLGETGQIFASSLLLSSLELGDTQVSEPSMRVRLGTASHFWSNTFFFFFFTLVQVLEGP